MIFQLVWKVPILCTGADLADISGSFLQIFSGFEAQDGIRLFSFGQISDRVPQRQRTDYVCSLGWAPRISLLYQYVSKYNPFLYKFKYGKSFNKCWLFRVNLLIDYVNVLKMVRWPKDLYVGLHTALYTYFEPSESENSSKCSRHCHAVV